MEVCLGRPVVRHSPARLGRKRAKVGKVMDEFAAGTLKSSSGQRVTNRKQAIAIAMSESGQTRRKKRR